MKTIESTAKETNKAFANCLRVPLNKNEIIIVIMIERLAGVIKAFNTCVVQHKQYNSYYSQA